MPIGPLRIDVDIDIESSMLLKWTAIVVGSILVVVLMLEKICELYQRQYICKYIKPAKERLLQGIKAQEVMMDML